MLARVYIRGMFPSGPFSGRGLRGSIVISGFVFCFPTCSAAAAFEFDFCVNYAYAVRSTDPKADQRRRLIKAELAQPRKRAKKQLSLAILTKFALATVQCPVSGVVVVHSDHSGDKSRAHSIAHTPHGHGHGQLVRLGRAWTWIGIGSGPCCCWQLSTSGPQIGKQARPGQDRAGSQADLPKQQVELGKAI